MIDDFGSSLRMNKSGTVEVGIYLAQLEDQTALGAAHEQLITTDSAAALELLKASVAGNDGNLALEPERVAKLCETLPASSMIRAYVSPMSSAVPDFAWSKGPTSDYAPPAVDSPWWSGTVK